MSNPKKTEAPAAIAETPAATAVALSLTEFCTRLSETVRNRPELIGGFYASEKAAGYSKGLESEFRERFDAFVKKPV